MSCYVLLISEETSHVFEKREERVDDERRQRESWRFAATGHSFDISHSAVHCPGSIRHRHRPRWASMTLKRLLLLLELHWLAELTSAANIGVEDKGRQVSLRRSLCLLLFFFDNSSDHCCCCFSSFSFFSVFRSSSFHTVCFWWLDPFEFPLVCSLRYLCTMASVILKINLKWMAVINYNDLSANSAAPDTICQSVSSY